MSGVNKVVRSPSRVHSRKGLYDEQGWKCNCNPRLPAAYFKTKKEGPNCGRFFYTCQKKNKQSGACSFFLWEDEAKSRETNVNLLNKREAPPASPSTRLRARTITRSSSFSSDIGTVTTAVTSPRPATKRSFMDDSDTEVDDWDGSTSDGEWTVIETVVRRSSSRPMGPPKTPLMTPRKEQRTNLTSSPSKAKALTGLIKGPSFHDYKEDNIFMTPSSHPAKSGLFSSTSAGFVNPSTPCSTPGGDLAMLSPQSQSPQRAPSTPLSAEFASILQANLFQLPRDVENAVQSLLDRQWRQTEGYRRARDITRQHLQRKTEELESKTKELTALQARIASLQAETEMERAVNLGLRSRLEELNINA